MDSSDKITYESHSCNRSGLGGSSTSEITQWTSYSLDHGYAAFHLAELSKETENNYQKEQTDTTQERTSISSKFVRNHRAYVTNSIFSAVAFLEATINELFLEAVDNPAGYYAEQLDSVVVTSLANS